MQDLFSSCFQNTKRVRGPELRGLCWWSLHKHKPFIGRPCESQQACNERQQLWCLHSSFIFCRLKVSLQKSRWVLWKVIGITSAPREVLRLRLMKMKSLFSGAVCGPTSWLKPENRNVYYIDKAGIQRDYVTLPQGLDSSGFTNLSVCFSAILVIRDLLQDQTLPTGLRASVFVWALPAATNQASVVQEVITFIYAKHSFFPKSPHNLTVIKECLNGGGDRNTRTVFDLSFLSSALATSALQKTITQTCLIFFSFIMFVKFIPSNANKILIVPLRTQNCSLLSVHHCWIRFLI